MSVQLYFLSPKSHLHVGSGSSNYGVIDNLVQRDPTDGFPSIYGSSLKGALKEHCEEVLNWKVGKEPDINSKTVFGYNEQKGKYAFSDVHLLGLPVKTNKVPYMIATCKYILNKFLTIVQEDYEYKALKPDLVNDIKTLAAVNVVQERPIIVGNAINDITIEDYLNVGNQTVTLSGAINKVLGGSILLLHDEDFLYQCSDYALPVIPRNSLDNGESTNLWYEQIVPRESRFFFFAERFIDSDSLDTVIQEHKVQIGANATIGEGKCLIKNFNKL
jgi:CRISPR-associated protein Cmr4